MSSIPAKKKSRVEPLPIAKRIGLLIGGELGAAAATEILDMKRLQELFIPVVAGIDFLYNSKNRIHAAAGEELEPRVSERQILLANSLPFPPGITSIKMKKRMVAQLLPYELLRRYDFPEDRIIRERLSEGLLLKLTEDLHIDHWIVAALGYQITAPVLQRVSVLACHPGPDIPKSAVYLPEYARGPDVYARMADEPGPHRMRVYMMEADPEWDKGLIVRRSYRFYTTFFADHEMAPELHDERVSELISASASGFSVLMRNHLISYCFANEVHRLVPFYSDADLRGMNFSAEQIADAHRRLDEVA